MDFLRKIIEMFNLHIVSNCHSGCCETKVEIEFSDTESHGSGGRRLSTDSVDFEEHIKTETVRRRSVSFTDPKLNLGN